MKRATRQVGVLRLFERLKILIWITSFIFQLQQITYVLIGGLYSYERQILYFNSSSSHKLGFTFTGTKLGRCLMQIFLFIPFLILIVINAKKEITVDGMDKTEYSPSTFENQFLGIYITSTVLSPCLIAAFMLK